MEKPEESVYHKGGFISGDIKAELHRDFVLTHEQIAKLKTLSKEIMKRLPYA